jgi:hypothetical protein
MRMRGFLNVRQSEEARRQAQQYLLPVSGCAKAQTHSALCAARLQSLIVADCEQLR